MATPVTSNNELVRSDSEIQAAVADADAADDVTALDPEPDGLVPDDDQDDGRRPWEDTGEDGSGDTADNPDTSAREDAQTVREFKANGATHKVNMSDQAAVDRLITLGLGARPVFTERDKLKKANQDLTGKVSDLQRYKDNWDKLDAAKHNKALLYEKIFGAKWADDVKAEADWSSKYALASPAEQRMMDMQRDMERKNADAEASRRTHDAERADLDKQRDGLKLDRYKGQMVPEFQRYEFSGRIKDEAKADRMNRALWKLAISDLKEQFGETDEIPLSAIRKAFRDTHDTLWGQHKEVATQEVKRVVDTKKKTAKDQAQLASTKNYTGGGKDKKPLPKDPVKLFKHMFR